MDRRDFIRANAAASAISMLPSGLLAAAPASDVRRRPATRIVYIDIDTFRPDHLGCYGYHRNTSPAMDEVARAGVRFGNIYTCDAPCLPSRTALFSGRRGYHTGVVDHAGTAADWMVEGAGRAFQSTLGRTNWMTCLRHAGLRTAMISPFAERHSAWWFCAGFSEIHNTGRMGQEIATEIEPVAIDWLKRNGHEQKWFLHVNLWDPHTPYRTPQDYGNPFENDPPPSWLTEDVRRQHWEGAGPESAQDAAEFYTLCRYGYPTPWARKNPRQPVQMSSMREVKRMFDGYDTALRYADDTVGRIISQLKAQGLYDDTAIIISGDHGENLGELNIYSAHMTGDEATCHIPLIVRWPGITDGQAGLMLNAFHSHFDLAPTVVELVGGKVPAIWDARSFAGSLRGGGDDGRDHLIISNQAGACQRSVRFGDHLCIRSYHDGYHCLPDLLLFDVRQDPHLQRDLAGARPDLVSQAMRLLDAWEGDAARAADHARDPMLTVLQAGGPEHTRGYLGLYLDRLRATGRARWADYLEKAHPREKALTPPPPLAAL